MAFTFTFLQVFFIAIYLTAPLLVFLGLLVLGLGQIVCHLEKWKKFDGLYWSLITATTVGYGDIRPLKKISRILSIAIAFVGIMFTGIMIALTLNAMDTSFKKHIDPQVIEDIKEKLD